MSRRIILAGLAALCALAFGAISASGASAQNTTAYTCVAGQGETSSHCDPGSTGEGNYGHVAIPASESTQLTIDPIGEVILSAEIFGAEIEMRATGVQCIDCMAENHEEGTEMDVTGSGGQLRFTDVTVNHHEEECTVVDDESVTGSGAGTPHQVTTTPLKLTTTGTNTVRFVPVVGSVLAHLKTETSPLSHERACPGALIHTINVEGEANGTTTGATLHLETGEGELAIEEEPLFVRATTTLEAGPTGGVHHPVALT